jgi:hypothetical protein
MSSHPARGRGKSDAQLLSDEWCARCSLCGRTFALDAWARLPVLDLMPPAGVSAHLLVTTDWSIEVRGCACGAPLARKSPHPGAARGAPPSAA